MDDFDLDHHNQDRHNDDHDDDIDDLDLDDNDNDNDGMSSSYQLNSTFDNLTVGSLPSSRRGRRFLVSNGNHERHANGNGSVSSGIGIGNGIGGGSGMSFGSHTGVGVGVGTGVGNRYNALSQSMPIPNAPLFGGRRDRAAGARLARYVNGVMLCL